MFKLTMNPEPTNARYQLEIYRNDLRNRTEEWHKEWGSCLFAIECTAQIISIICSLVLCTTIGPSCRIHRTVTLLTLASILALFVVCEHLISGLLAFRTTSSDIFMEISDMLSALGRFYETGLLIAWLFATYFTQKRFHLLLQGLIVVPALGFFAFLLYYITINEYINEAFPSGLDTINIAALVVVLVVWCTCFVSGRERQQKAPKFAYLLPVALLALLLNTPTVISTIARTFVLDQSWSYTLRMYCIDVAVEFTYNAKTPAILAYLYSTSSHLPFTMPGKGRKDMPFMLVTLHHIGSERGPNGTARAAERDEAHTNLI